MVRRSVVASSLAALLASLIGGRSSAAHAQATRGSAAPPPAPSITINAVQVRVRDSAGVAVSGAEVAVVRGLNEVRGTSTSDERGRAIVRLASPAPGDSVNEYQLVVRKIGYARADRFVKLTRDSALFDVEMIRAAQELNPVVVRAEEDVKRKAYHIDADQIENSSRLLFNAADILAKLRPDMICGRTCRPAASGIQGVQTATRRCPGLAFSQPRVCPKDDSPPPIDTNVWVNGRHIRIVPLDEVALARQVGMLAGLKPGTMTVLSEIRPEHIAEMTYVDEFDNVVDKPGAHDALFIVLKPGVDYDPGKPSFVVKAVAQTTDTAQTMPAKLPAYRYRLLGVFDADSGDPIADAVVTDLSSGSYVKTSASGTISLVFLEEGTSPLRISRPGYRDLNLTVEIGANAASPLTLVMEHAPGSTKSPHAGSSALFANYEAPRHH